MQEKFRVWAGRQSETTNATTSSERKRSSQVTLRKQTLRTKQILLELNSEQARNSSSSSNGIIICRPLRTTADTHSQPTQSVCLHKMEGRTDVCSFFAHTGFHYSGILCGGGGGFSYLSRENKCSASKGHNLYGIWGERPATEGKSCVLFKNAENFPKILVCFHPGLFVWVWLFEVAFYFPLLLLN